MLIISKIILSVDLKAPTNLSAVVESCDNITLQWDQPSEPNDITTSVSCTPPSPGCAECTTSPCTITGLNPSTEYEFTVTLHSGRCRASMNSKVTITRGEIRILLVNDNNLVYLFLSNLCQSSFCRSRTHLYISLLYDVMSLLCYHPMTCMNRKVTDSDPSMASIEMYTQMYTQT